MPPKAPRSNPVEHPDLSRAVDRLADQLSVVSTRLTEVSARQTEQLDRIADEQRTTATILDSVERRLAEHDTKIAVIEATVPSKDSVVALSRRDAKVAGAFGVLALLASGLVLPLVVDLIREALR